MTIYIGADWDQKSVVFAAGKPEQNPSWTGEVNLNTDDIHTWKQQLNTRFPDEDFSLAIERGFPLWATVFQKAGCTVYVIDPNRSKAFADAVCASAAKSDRADANTLFLIAQNPKVRRQPLPETDDANAALMRLARRHELMVKELNRTTNRIRSRLAEVFVGLDLPDLKRQWVCDFLTATPTASHYQHLSESDQTALLSGLGMKGKQREKLTSALCETFHHLGKWEAEVVGEEVQSLVAQLRQQLSHRKAIESKMDELVSLKSETSAQLRSVDGIGAKLCGYLMALYFFGSPTTSQRDALSIRLGASPVTIQTGQKTRRGEAKPRVVMRRSAPDIGRRTVYLLGLQAVKNLGWAKAQYRYLRDHGKSHALALRCVSRSLLRILSSMHRRGLTYDDARYVQALKSKGVVWAKAL
jgi:transposase